MTSLEFSAPLRESSEIAIASFFILSICSLMLSVVADVSSILAANSSVVAELSVQTVLISLLLSFN